MSKNQLCIQISENFCSFVELKHGEIEFIENIRFTEKKDFQYKERLKEIFLKSDKLKEEFEEISLTWVSKTAVIIPSSIFLPTEIESLFLSCFQDKNHGFDLDYNRLMENSLVCVYEIPLWVKSFFIIKFPRIVIQHECTNTARGILKQAFSLHIQVSIFPDLMLLSIVDKNELKFYNTYDIAHSNDIIYYLSFVMQQEDLINKTCKINFSIHNSVEDHGNSLEKNLNLDLNKITLFNASKITFNHIQLLKFQEFCV